MDQIDEHYGNFPECLLVLPSTFAFFPELLLFSLKW